MSLDRAFLVGFDDLRELIDRIGRNHDNYPPYNVEVMAPHGLRISIAVAGFTAEQLRIEVKGAHLTVSAGKERDGPEREYLHRGIALRGFQRAFVLSGGFEVTGARLAYGLLHIALERPAAAETGRIIPIVAG